MKKKYYIYGILAGSCTLIFGCNTIKSSYHFTRGTECLDQANYQGAIEHLEQAVELDPSMSRNHCNLAFAYHKSGQLKKSWFNARQAVLLDPTNMEAVQNMHSIYTQLNFDKQIIPGISIDESINLLGEPDIEIKGKTTTLIYGNIIFKFDSEGNMYAMEEMQI